MTKVICPPCDSVLDDCNSSEGEQKAEWHNESLHDGEEIAMVEDEPITEDRLNEIMDRAKEVCNQQQYEQFVSTVVNDYDNLGHLE